VNGNPRERKAGFTAQRMRHFLLASTLQAPNGNVFDAGEIFDWRLTGFHRHTLLVVPRFYTLFVRIQSIPKRRNLFHGFRKLAQPAIFLSEGAGSFGFDLSFGFPDGFAKV
jgi:hypothetical protein